MGKNLAPSDNDKGSIRPVNRRGQTLNGRKRLFDPPNHVIWPDLQLRIVSNRRDADGAIKIKNISLQFKCALFILIIQIILADEIREIRRPR